MSYVEWRRGDDPRRRIGPARVDVAVREPSRQRSTEAVLEEDVGAACAPDAARDDGLVARQSNEIVVLLVVQLHARLRPTPLSKLSADHILLRRHRSDAGVSEPFREVQRI